MTATFDIRKLRNIGIIAHIDAGKTTTTERILYYAGESHKMGDVDDGTTVTDFDPQEQEKGITIRAAAITFRWRDVRINLIDTPGHVDFTAEVERSLRVLDGGVVVFSGVEGVEAQSETVWRQADHYRVPRLCFINKLDRIGADFERVYEEMGARLGARTIPLQIPIGREKDFTGVVDLVTQQAVLFDSASLGKKLWSEAVPASLTAEVDHWRDRLIEALADLDDRIAEAYLEGGPIPQDWLRAAIRRATVELGMNPVLCGSALKYIGVQPLLDAVAEYLPSPLDVPPIEGTTPDGKRHEARRPRDSDPFCGLVFKIQADQHDELAFVRVYSGTLKPQSRVLNAGRDLKENVTRLWHIQADRRSRVELIGAGDIVGIVGLKQSYTGDTLCDPKAPLVLERIVFPETVISMSIEPESSADRQKLLDVLNLVQKEDPTFRVRVDRDTGETLINGMGELHLEVVTERIRRDFRLQIRTSKPRVSYRETIRNAVAVTGECHRQTASGPLFAQVRVELAPLAGPDRVGLEKAKESFAFVNRCPAEVLPPALLAVVEDELKNECLAGGLYGYPLSGLQAVLCGALYREGESNEQAFRFAVADAVRKGLEAGGVNILEPIMKLEVVTPEQYFGDVIADLGVRRAIIEDAGMRGVYRVITARAPLREMFGYSTALRSLSQGRASYTMEPLGYEPAPDDVARKLV